MHQCAIAMSGSSCAAWAHERSDSRNQNECICEIPCRKNLRASSDVVVTGKSFVFPMPVSSFAGSNGCAPGGTTHKSGSRGAAFWLAAARTLDEKVDRMAARTMKGTAKAKRFIALKYRAGRAAL